MESSCGFNNRPILLASNALYHKSAVENLRSAHGCWLVGDLFYLMTEAWAAWFLLELASSRQPRPILSEIETTHQTSQFFE
jgi:hypothetical protein